MESFATKSLPLEECNIGQKRPGPSTSAESVISWGLLSSNTVGCQLAVLLTADGHVLPEGNPSVHLTAAPDRELAHRVKPLASGQEGADVRVERDQWDRIRSKTSYQ